MPTRVQRKRSGNNTFDFVVVGAGSAGCVLANRLSACGTYSVALLESGGEDSYPWLHIPVGYLYTMNNPRTDWCYSTEKQKELNGRSISYPRGRVLGGSSSINGMIYMRGQKADYENWSAENPGWSWEDVLPLFRKSLDYAPSKARSEILDLDLYSSGGEWRVESQRLSWDVLDDFALAAEDVGIPMRKDFNSSDEIGSGYFQVNQVNGIRWSTSKAFLKPALDRKNLEIFVNATVSKILLERNYSVCATAVEFVDKNQNIQQLYAKREVVLCAGAIGSPLLLQVSGIGPADLLSKHGVTPICDLRGVGQNLQDHLQLRSVYRLKKGTKTLNTLANSLFGKVAMAIEYALHQSGPLAMAPSQLGIFCRSKHSETPNMQYHVQPLSLDKFGEPLHPFPGITAAVCNLRPSSRGSVTLSGPTVFDPPLVDPNYLHTEKDKSIAAEGLQLTREIVFSEKFRSKYNPEEYLPGEQYQLQDELAEAAGRIGTSIFHPVGTCKMGPKHDTKAVVDSRLRVHKVRNLRIADASIMPTITSGNTNSPTIMIAEKASEMMLKEA